MGLDEVLFAYLLKSIKAVRGKGTSDAHLFRLLDHRRRFSILASALSGRSLDIQFTDHEYGISETELYLPATEASLETYELNSTLSFYRLLILAHGLNQRSIDWPWVESDFHREYPSASALRERIVAHPIATQVKFILLPFHYFADSKHSKSSSLAPGQSRNKNGQSHGKSYKAKTVHRPRTIQLPEGDSNPVVHVFEKVQTVDEYNGGQRTVDGSDEMSGLSEAFEESPLSQVTRSAQSAQSMVKSDAVIETQAAIDEPVEKTEDKSEIFFFDEWSKSSQTYLKNWCRVRVDATESQTPTSHTSTIQTRRLGQKIQQDLSQILNLKAVRKRLSDGTDFDFDATLDQQIERRVIANPTNRIYEKRSAIQQDYAFCILVDGSLSTDSYVSGIRINDLIKDSLHVLRYALEDFEQTTTILSFRSFTRSDCRITKLKDWSEPWPKVPGRIETLTPDGFTRLGPALRYAAHTLNQLPAKTRFLFVLSDSKPTDYDAYEGQHGLADVNRAVQEVHAGDSIVHAFILSDERSSRFNDLYGPGRFDYLLDINRIGPTLTHLLRRR
ncbi:MAG: hypothetical protein IPJ84_14120 [Bdellovibrionales bacterium]|nr:hypothetical protein [Bdellovibrionales bacterium]